MALPEQVHGSENEGMEGEEGLKPPPYTFDAGGPVAEGGYGDGHGEGNAGALASPAPVHLQSS